MVSNRVSIILVFYRIAKGILSYIFPDRADDLLF